MPVQPTQPEQPDAPLLRTGRVRASGWTGITRGVHVPSGSDPLLGWQHVLPPDGRFTHLTAAAHRGWWLPPLPSGLPVLGSCTGTARPQRRGLVMARHEALPCPETVDGVRVDPAPEVLLACARDLALLDLVVLTDSALRAGTSREAVAAACAGRRRGAPALRAALLLADERSESPWETLLRLLHVLVEVAVEPQHVLLDDAGGFVARGDLWLVGTNALHEYDGAHHLTRRGQRDDLRRGRGIENTNWVRRGYTSDDVLHHAVAVLRDADLSLGREHEPARVRAWHRELAQSAFSPSGRTRLAGRLRRRQNLDRASR